MSIKEKNVFESLRQTAKDVLPEGGHVWLYGSRARGEAHNQSDWDILLLFDKQKVEQSDYDNVVYPFTELGWKLGEMIIPIVYTTKEWQEASLSEFYDNVERDKIVLI